MAAAGAGHPSRFLCPGLREIPYEQRDDIDIEAHTVKLTGASRTTRARKAHSRSSKLDRRWTCDCGRSGWSNHIDLEPKLQLRP